ncbi:MAG: recombination-associated protein RdgC [Candidatus Sumerlaeia bacterium]|nr:recombination-associated protein RdgC [Candidatus Sumerlaeia bacterium]
MGFFSGSITARRYSVTGETGEAFFTAATQALRRYAYQSIRDDQGERESFGWVNPRKVLERKIDFEEMREGNLVFLGVRRDRKVLSPVLVRARLEERLAEETGKRKLQRVTRQMRQALEEEVMIAMLRETSPTSAFHEAVWDTARAELYVGGSGDALCERVKDLFEATFGLVLRPRHPALIGAEHISAQGLEEEFQATLRGGRVDHGSGGGDDGEAPW